MAPRLTDAERDAALRGRVVAAARRWLGVRFAHQGRDRAGVDCAGLVILVARDLGFVAPDFDVTGYERRPHGDTLLEACARHLAPVASGRLAPGHVALFRDGPNPQHLAVVGDHPMGGLSMIHAYAPSRRVVENRLDHVWLSRLCGAFAFRRG